MKEHEVLMIRDDCGDEWDEVIVEFDGMEVAKVYFNYEEGVLFLASIDLRKYNLAGKGFGTKIINILEKKFRGGGLNDKIVFLVRFREETGSGVFYKKLGFKKLNGSEDFTKKEIFHIGFLLDPFCDDRNLVYKII